MLCPKIGIELTWKLGVFMINKSNSLKVCEEILADGNHCERFIIADAGLFTSILVNPIQFFQKVCL
jgi:hypothetical protein